MAFLSQVVKGKIKRPYNIIVYGPEFAGKTVFASKAPSPIFIASERGTDTYDVERMHPQSFADVLGMIEELRTQKHEYKTLVIDSLDWVEPMIWKEVCRKNNWETIESPGYGKGYNSALPEWVKLKDALMAVRDEREMHIILIAHSKIKTFMDPTSNVGYDRYILKMHEAASSMLREAVDEVLFANFEVFTKGKQGQKGMAVGDGDRVMYTERRPAFDAKNRHSLPFQMKLSWADFATEANKINESPEKLRTMIEGLLANVTDDELKQRVAKATIDAKDDMEKLNKILDKLRTKVGG